MISFCSPYLFLSFSLRLVNPGVCELRERVDGLPAPLATFFTLQANNCRSQNCQDMPCLNTPTQNLSLGWPSPMLLVLSRSEPSSCPLDPLGTNPPIALCKKYPEAACPALCIVCHLGDPKAGTVDFHQNWFIWIGLSIQFHIFLELVAIAMSFPAGRTRKHWLISMAYWTNPHFGLSKYRGYHQ